MSKNILMSDIRRRCRAYPKDTDTFRVSQHRLEEFLEERDAAMLVEIDAIRTELKEQKQVIAAIKKYRKKVGTSPTGKEMK